MNVYVILLQACLENTSMAGSVENPKLCDYYSDLMLSRGTAIAGR